MKFLWMIAGGLGASILIVLFAYILICLVRSISANLRKGGGQDGR